MKLILLMLLLLPSISFAARTQYFDAENYNFGGVGNLTKTELYYLDGVTSNIQTQLDAKAADSAVMKLTTDQSASGVKTFTGKIVASSTTNGFRPCPTMTQGQRDAVVGPSAADCVYNSTTGSLNIYDGSTWKSAGGGLSAWATSISYSVGDVVIYGTNIYSARTAHTSGTFTSDVANWVLLSSTGSNSLYNPGGEHPTDGFGWTVSVGSFTTSTTNAHTGNGSVRATSTLSQLVVSQSTTRNATSLSGTQGVATVFISTARDNMRVCPLIDGSSTGCLSIINDGAWREYVMPFVFGSTSYGIIVESTVSGTGSVSIDDAYVGFMPSTMTPEVAQAQLAVDAYIAGTTSCSWTRTNTAIGALTSTAACPGPTIVRQNVCSWQTTDSDLPRFTGNNCPPGQYIVEMYPRSQVSAGGMGLAIFDGTTISEAVQGNNSTNGVGAPVKATFNYTDTGNRSFELYTGSSSGTVTISNDNASAPRISLRMVVTYIPPASKVYSQANQDQETWIPFTPTGSWTTNTTYTGKYRRVGDSIDLKYYIVVSGAPSSGTLYVNMPTINGSALSIDTNKINLQSNNGTFLSNGNIRDQGTTNYGPVYASWDSASRMVVQSGTSINPVTPTAPMTWANTDTLTLEVFGIPVAGWTSSQITATFANVVTAPGISKPKQFSFNLANSSTQTAPCTASPCTVNSNNGGVVTGITRTSAGLYVVAMSNLGSAELMCFYTLRNWNTGSTVPSCYTTIKSQTSMTWQCTAGAGTAMDSAVDFQCQGTAP